MAVPSLINCPPMDYREWLDDNFTPGELWQKKSTRRTPVIRVGISVEGQTEEEFVKRILGEHLRSHGIEPTPVLLGRARSQHGGGRVSLDRLVPEICHLVGFFDFVTSFVDFYGFQRKGDRTVRRVGGTIGTTHWQENSVKPGIRKP